MSRQGTNSYSRGCAALILSLMCAALLAAGILSTGITWVKYRGSERWPAAEGTVIVSKVVSTDDSDSFEILYTYAVNDVVYQGDVACPLSEIESPGQCVRRYPKGSSVRVYYNPRRPSVACLEPGISTRMLFLRPTVYVLLLLFVMCLTLGGAFLLALYRDGRRRQSAGDPD